MKKELQKILGITVIAIIVAASVWLVIRKPDDSSVQREVNFWSDLSNEADN